MKKIIVSGILILSVAAVCATNSNAHQTLMYYQKNIVKDTIPGSSSKTNNDSMYNNNNMQNQNSLKTDTANHKNNPGTVDSTRTPQ